MGFNIGDAVEVIGGKWRGKEGQVSAIPSPGRYSIRLQVIPAEVANIAEKDLKKPKWDHKHGLAGKTQDFVTDAGVISSGASLAKKKVLERVLELFGKTSDPRPTRLRGLPSHVAAMNNELTPPTNPAARRSYDADAEKYKAVEQAAISALLASAEAANIDIPPIAAIYPLLGRVVILSRKNGALARQEDYFALSDLADIRAQYVMDVNVLGTYYQSVAAYQNFNNYQPNGERWVTVLMEQGLADGYQ